MPEVRHLRHDYGLQLRVVGGCCCCAAPQSPGIVFPGNARIIGRIDLVLRMSKLLFGVLGALLAAASACNGAPPSRGLQEEAIAAGLVPLNGPYPVSLSQCVLQVKMVPKYPCGGSDLKSWSAIVDLREVDAASIAASGDAIYMKYNSDFEEKATAATDRVEAYVSSHRLLPGEDARAHQISISNRVAEVAEEVGVASRLTFDGCDGIATFEIFPMSGPRVALYRVPDAQIVAKLKDYTKKDCVRGF